MRRVVIGLMVALTFPLCMGQSCSSSILNSVVDGINSGVNDATGNGTVTITPTGIPAGQYTPSGTLVETKDNLSDAYPADTFSTPMTGLFIFNSNGVLVRSDNSSPLAVGDVVTTSTQWGDVQEQVTTVVPGTNVVQYATDATMVLNGEAGLTWNLTGTGLRTFRLSGGKLLYSGSVDMTSDTAGGVSYEVTIDFSNVTLTK